MVDLKDAYAEVNQKMLQSSTSMNREVSAELRNSLSTFMTIAELRALTSSVTAFCKSVTNVEREIG